MIEFYTQIKMAHIICVILSGSLFLLRAVLALSGNRVANHVVLRWLSYAIDTTLLTAALMLMTIVHQYPFVQAWLTVKVLLLVVYIVLGVFALRRAQTWRGRLYCTCAAVAVYLFMASIAWWHDPRGALLWLYR